MQNSKHKSGPFISFELAEKLHKLGIVVPYDISIRSNLPYMGQGEFKGSRGFSNDCGIMYKCYTLDEVRQWLLDVLNIHIDVALDQTSEPKYVYSIVEYDKISISYRNLLGQAYSDLFYDYYECLNHGILKFMSCILQSLESTLLENHSFKQLYLEFISKKQ